MSRIVQPSTRNAPACATLLLGCTFALAGCRPEPPPTERPPEPQAQAAVLQDAIQAPQDKARATQAAAADAAERQASAIEDASGG
ncbi:hypothetical protein [Pseudoxanthomonas sp. 10H]|uniref:hypothetical protein n=1 Tax=Pseudoxanthomonas sp. 10H TaxID=3242729 RepID=UPI003556C0CF